MPKKSNDKNIKVTLSKGNIISSMPVISFKNEIFTKILSEKNITIEKIYSSGQTTPEGVWLKDNRNEWVLLIKGKAVLNFKNVIINMKEGDYVFIPYNTLHRVEYTSKKPRCIWLAIYFNN